MKRELIVLKDSTFDIPIISELILASLQRRKADVPEGLTHEDWEQILGICAAQKIHTFVYDALPEAAVPEDIRSIWEMQVKANERASALVDAIVAAQEKAWRKRGLKYALMKGPSVAALYPVPPHRHCGDIDWWFADKESWDAALELAGRNAEDGVHIDSDGDINYVFKGVVIEHHRDWTHLSSRRLRRLVGSPELIDGRFGPGDTLLSLVCHILHHVAWKGANLKQVVDLAAALKYYDGKYDREHFAQRLKCLGLTKWFSFLASFIDGTSTDSADVRRFQSVLLERKPRLFSRFALMWKASPRECVARYFFLIFGRISRKI